MTAGGEFSGRLCRGDKGELNPVPRIFPRFAGAPDAQMGRRRKTVPEISANCLSSAG